MRQCPGEIDDIGYILTLYPVGMNAQQLALVLGYN